MFAETRFHTAYTTECHSSTLSQRSYTDPDTNNVTYEQQSTHLVESRSAMPIFGARIMTRCAGRFTPAARVEVATRTLQPSRVHLPEGGNNEGRKLLSGGIYMRRRARHESVERSSGKCLPCTLGLLIIDGKHMPCLCVTFLVLIMHQWRYHRTS